MYLVLKNYVHEHAYKGQRYKNNIHMFTFACQYMHKENKQMKLNSQISLNY